MTLRNVLLEQLAAIYDENNWFVCFNLAVKDLTEYQANEKPDDGQSNSIFELVSHLYFYNYRYLCRFCGEEIPDYPRYYDTFQNHDGLTWEQTVKNYQECMIKFRRQLRMCSDEKLEKWAETISHLLIHNAYHIGQIVHIRKQFGTWTSSPVVRG
ncbi:DinB family protein [Halobacillus yeomjeoni]|uniref:DinB family protein n=1 Tax=Halobacillus yeomjeoni TaxID=311194 RepID=UPI001CD3F2BE|nr:DinB family protein [Halobacillus yeomjeoni]MCA0984163.1 DinB family protein [Halobacillus yeomjeoni]